MEEVLEAYKEPGDPVLPRESSNKWKLLLELLEAAISLEAWYRRQIEDFTKNFESSRARSTPTTRLEEVNGKVNEYLCQILIGKDFMSIRTSTYFYCQPLHLALEAPSLVPSIPSSFTTRKEQ